MVAKHFNTTEKQHNVHNNIKYVKDMISWDSCSKRLKDHQYLPAWPLLPSDSHVEYCWTYQNF